MLFAYIASSHRISLQFRGRMGLQHLYGPFPTQASARVRAAILEGCLPYPLHRAAFTLALPRANAVATWELHPPPLTQDSKAAESPTSLYASVIGGTVASLFAGFK